MSFFLFILLLSKEKRSKAYKMALPASARTPPPLTETGVRTPKLAEWRKTTITVMSS